jgi:hypothetical protein
VANTIGKDEYRCEGCGGVFKKGWSDEEALAELKEVWGDIPVSECGVICDDCNQLFMAWMAQQRKN